MYKNKLNHILRQCKFIIADIDNFKFAVKYRKIKCKEGNFEDIYLFIKEYALYNCKTLGVDFDEVWEEFTNAVDRLQVKYNICLAYNGSRL